MESGLEVKANLSEDKLRALQERYEVEVERLKGERREKEGHRKEVDRLNRVLHREEERSKGIRER